MSATLTAGGPGDTVGAESEGSLVVTVSACSAAFARWSAMWT